MSTIHHNYGVHYSSKDWENLVTRTMKMNDSRLSMHFVRWLIPIVSMYDYKAAMAQCYALFQSSSQIKKPGASTELLDCNRQRIRVAATWLYAELSAQMPTVSEHLKF